MGKSRASKEMMMEKKEMKPMMKVMPKKMPPKKMPPKEMPGKTMMAGKEKVKDMSQYDDLGYITKAKKK